MSLPFDPREGLIVVPTRLWGPVEKIEALEQERRNFPILCHTLPPSATVDGVLGLDFFRGQRLVVDFRTGLVTVE